MRKTSNIFICSFDYGVKLNFVRAEWKFSSFLFEAITKGFREQDLMILCRAKEEILNLI